MAFAKVTLNDESIIDLTNDTPTEETVHENYVALGVDGLSVIGEELPSLENEIIEKKLISYSDSEMTIVTDYMFIWQTIMEEVSLPNIEAINQYGFYHCESLTSVNFPKATSLGNYSFCSDFLLTEANLPKVTSIGTYAFYENNLLTTLNATNITSIGTYAFYNCNSLININLASITAFPSYSFYGCSSLGGINSLVATSIADNAFNGCTNLQDAIFPEVLTLSKGSFRSCSNLRNINFKKLTGCGVGGSTFNGCSKIPLMVLPNYTGSINADFINGCSLLTTLDIQSPTNIAALGLRNATAMTTLIIRKGTLCTLSNISGFNGTPFASGKAGGTLYVPNDLIESYQTATNWSTILGYANNNIESIEGSQYEFYYADGTPIPTEELNES